VLLAIIVQLLYKLKKQGENKSAVKRACIQENKKRSQLQVKD